MRIVVDMQGAQGKGSRFRGIGRYTLAIVKALIRNQGNHQIILAFNGNLVETVDPMLFAFSGLLPMENIRIWQSSVPIAYHDKNNDWRRNSAELVYESFLSSLKPDFIYVTSLFEDIGDDVATSVHRMIRNTPVAVMLYDLVPYLYPKLYLENPAIKAWYLEKIEHLRKADLWLAISEASRQDGIVHLGLPNECVVNISADADPFFQPMPITQDRETNLCAQYGIFRPFVLCVGGIDCRKNIEALIRAFAQLPQSLRSGHQLIIVSPIYPAMQDKLKRLIKKQGLGKQDVVLAGFISDEDLVDFYNLCKLFVFPSWYEGFGFPVLEAMRCGAPVIGANTSSLPEVIGWDEALFDPHSDKAIAQVIERGLVDDQFRKVLLKHCEKQARKFSWDESARRVISAMERRREQWNNEVSSQLPTRLKLAYVSPLPPIPSKIAGFSAKLLQELNKFYDIDVIVVQSDITDAWISKHFPVRSPEWLQKNSGHYDRVLYHFGNSEFHQHMFQLLENVPGVVVLHDFFLSGILAHMELANQAIDIWRKSLYESHGYIALHERQNSGKLEEIIWKYPCSRSVAQHAVGIIVHDTEFQRLACPWYGDDTNNWSFIPSMDGTSKNCAAQYRDVIEGHYKHAEGHMSSLSRAIATQVGGADDAELIKFSSAISSNLPPACRAWQLLVDVSTPIGSDGEYALMPQLKAWLELPPYGCRVEPVYMDDDGCYFYARKFTAHFLGYEMALSDEPVEYWAGDVFMRTGSGIEFDSFQQNEIYRHMRQHGVELRVLAKKDEPFRHEYRVQSELAWILERIDRNGLTCFYDRQLFVDVSMILINDLRTGIQRVVRSILYQLCFQKKNGFRIEPIYSVSGHNGYFYARHLFSKGRYKSSPEWDDGAITFRKGDIFLGLDLNHNAVVINSEFYQNMRRAGVRVEFVVYDLLPVLSPEFFGKGTRSLHEAWLKVIAQCDGAMCISKSVANELEQWLSERCLLQSGFRIEWFHLGADIEISIPSRGSPESTETVLSCISTRVSFLMVGTLEPRKGQAQVLAAFELLWKKGMSINLVIAGKRGWMMEVMIEKILNNPEFGKRLFLFENSSDECLKSIYEASTCLIAASKGEGFGLPIIEAARYGLPIIARDIPVFREVAYDNAVYFSGENDNDLAGAIEEWMNLYKKGDILNYKGVSWLTWQQSTELLLKKIMKF